MIQRSKPSRVPPLCGIRLALPVVLGLLGVLAADVLLGLTRVGLGGPMAGGHQFMSWIHDRDFARAILFLIEHERFEGPVNLTAPGPLPQRDFMAALREAMGMRIGLPATAWMARIGAWFLRTDMELTFKSRRVVPTRLLEEGFNFDFPEWAPAARDLVERHPRNLERI